MERAIQVSQRGTFWGTVRVELLDSAKRGIYFKELMAAWQDEVGALPGATVLTFVGDEVAPPGAPIEVWLQGHQMDEILAVSEQLKQKLATYDGVYQIQDDFRPGKNEMKLALKTEARTLGITVADLARQVRGGYFGEEVLRLQRGRDDVRVRVRYPADERDTIAGLDSVRIRPFSALASLGLDLGGQESGGEQLDAASAGGMDLLSLAALGGSADLSGGAMEVPLFSVADIEHGPGYAAINRTDGMRRVAVTAEVDSAKTNANEIVSELRTSYFQELRTRYPSVNLSFQGEQESLREALASLYVSYPLVLLGIFIIIATIFRSYVQPLVIMVTVPFGILGAIYGHMLMGFDVTMMSLFGIVALAGVVVNDAIILIECVNGYIANGESFYAAVRKGGARRFRAIFLTTISTVGGLTPLIIEKDFQAQILIPMAISIAAGVAFATLLTLLLVPCLLCVLNDLRRIVHRVMQGYWPTPEEVEPARLRKLNVFAEGQDVAEGAVQ